jgi:hypothetical protein
MFSTADLDDKVKDLYGKLADFEIIVNNEVDGPVRESAKRNIVKYYLYLLRLAQFT